MNLSFFIFVLIKFVSSDIVTSVMLKQLEDRVIKLISKPKLSYRDTVQREFLEYYMTLDRLYDLMKELDPKGKDIITEIKAAGGPNLRKVKLDGPLLINVFQWTEDDVLELNATIRGINKLWNDVELAQTINPTTDLNPELYMDAL
uniref:Uncharacterized protein n=1 Tax=Clastoptera arizonana TaxID=38151 RepID=A0A1B6CHH7_9HEMI